MTKNNISILLALLCALTTWKLWPSSSPADINRGPNAKLLLNRVWIDAIPKTQRDKVEVFLMLDEQNIGLYSKSSSFEGDWAGFEWSLSGGLHITMLQEQKEYKLETKIRSGKHCAPFDHCLNIKGAPRGAKLYGSMDDWIITDTSVPQNPQELVRQFFFNTP